MTGKIIGVIEAACRMWGIPATTFLITGPEFYLPATTARHLDDRIARITDNPLHTVTIRKLVSILTWQIHKGLLFLSKADLDPG